MRKLSLLTVLASVLALSTGVAGAASAGLTHIEYQQLLKFQSAAATRSMKTLAAVESDQRACRSLSPVSAFMRADRTDCNATFDWLETSVRALARVKACAHGTTVSSRMGCMRPAYAALAGSVRGMYHAELHTYRAVVRRGFTGSCERALADGPKSLVHEAQMLNAITRMVSAMRGDNLLAVQKWGSLYDAATAETESAASKISVVVCPHR